MAPVARAAARPRGDAGDGARPRGARRDPRRGSPTTSGGSCRRAPRPCSGRRSVVELVAARRAGTRRRRRRRVARRPARAADAVNPRHTFDQFVIGDANRLAHAAALAVAELPGLAYNPLYICGPPGLGKTHLLHSIANYLADCGDMTRPLHHRRGLHEPLPRRAPRPRHRRVQGRLPRRGRPARRRRPVPRGQGADGAGVLPHLQRAPPGRRPGRPHLGPPAARHGPPSRTACASASRPGCCATSPRPTAPRA